MSFTLLIDSPNPQLPADRIVDLLSERYGMPGAEVSPLGSTQDQNFRAVAVGERYVVKVANVATPEEELDLQNAAMLHLGAAPLGVATPRPVAGTDGAQVTTLDGYLVRVATWVDGAALADAARIGLSALRALGDVAAQCAEALADFEHPVLARELQWDPRHALRAAGELATGLLLTARQETAVRRALGPGQALRHGDLPFQAVHLDVTDYNVVGHVGADGRFVPTGLIDVGDVVRTWRIAELAHAAMSALFPLRSDPLGGVLAVVEGYAARLALTSEEADALWPLVLTRAAVNALSSTRQAAVAGASDHLERLMGEDWGALDVALGVSADLATAAIRTRCGLDR